MVREAPPPKIIQRSDDHADRANNSLAAIYAKIAAVLANRDRFRNNPSAIFDALDKTLAELEALWLTAAFGSRISGWIAPWAPRVIPAPVGRAEGKPAALPPPSKQLAKSQWPSVQAGIDWLTGQDVLDESKLDELLEDTKGAINAIGAISRVDFVEKIGESLQESFAAGESKAQWNVRIKNIAFARRGLDETIHRTFTHRAYHEGLLEVQDDPIVAEEFPYLLYSATPDDRVRDSHWDEDKKVAHKDSPTARFWRDLVAEWSCRCTLIPITKAEAKRRGINDNIGAAA